MTTSCFRNRATAGWLATVALVMAGSASCDRWSSPETRLRKAEAEIAAGNLGFAEAELRSVVRDLPANVDARIALAEVALALGDAPLAEQQLSRAAELHAAPQRIESLKWRIAIALGHYEVVARELASARPGLTEPARSRLLAEAAVGTGQFAEAIDRYRALLSTPDGHTEDRIGLARALSFAGREDEGLAELDAVPAGDPLALRTVVLRGQMLARAGRLPEAAQTLTDALSRAEPARDRALISTAAAILADVEFRNGQIDAAKAAIGQLAKEAPNSVSTRLLQARLALIERRYDAAVEGATTVLRAIGDEPQALRILGIAHMELGHLGQAEASFARAVELQQNDSVVRKLLAEVQFREGRVDEARATLAPVVDSAVPDQGAVLMLARLALSRRDPASAVRLLEDAHKRDAADDSVKLELAAAYLSAGRSSDALALLNTMPPSVRGKYRAEFLRVYALPHSERTSEVQRFLAEHATDAYAHYLAALDANANGQADVARRELQAAVETAPRDPTLLTALGELELRAGNLDAAESNFRALLAIGPRSSSAEVALARIAIGRGQSAEAIRWLEQARREDPYAVLARVGLARLYAARRDFDAARRAIREARAVAPRRADLLAVALEVEEQAGNSSQGSALLDEALRSQPKSAELWLMKGQYAARQHNYPDARSAFTAALAIQPDLVTAEMSLAMLDVEHGDIEGALAIARKLKSSVTTLYEGFVVEGEAEDRRGNPQAAVRAFDRALELRPSSSLVLRRSRTEQLAHLSGATERLKAWLDQYPRDADVRLAYAGALEASREVDAAIREYQAIVAVAPQNAIALNNLATLYQARGDARALATARSAYVLKPDAPAIMDTLGWILASSGASAEGNELLKAAASASPGDPEIQYHYAWAIAKAGHQAEAARILTNTLSGKIDFRSRASAAALLKELTGNAT